ncbi:hypothetical protein MG293_018587 [Ovis ammon polii]|uniref:Uncharacterized protein n=1 Tax=Ovis ammon polii TaxID=230172 RepID=A0AAD4TQW1_OVIAM|nr:hypothetical protein MG293_018587 [Ovis ammon polii]
MVGAGAGAGGSIQEKGERCVQKKCDRYEPAAGTSGGDALTSGPVEDVSASTGSWLRWAQCRICHNDSAAPAGGGRAEAGAGERAKVYCKINFPARRIREGVPGSPWAPTPWKQSLVLRLKLLVPSSESPPAQPPGAPLGSPLPRRFCECWLPEGGHSSAYLPQQMQHLSPTVG